MTKRKMEQEKEHMRNDITEITMTVHLGLIAYIIKALSNAKVCKKQASIQRGNMAQAQGIVDWSC